MIIHQYCYHRDLINLNNDLLNNENRSCYKVGYL